MAEMVANIPKAPPQRIMLSLSVVWSVKAITLLNYYRQLIY